MTIFGSIRTRLTAWYAATLAIVLILFFGSAWLAMRASILKTVDRDLANRIVDVREFIERESSVSRAELEDELREEALLGMGGVLLQVTEADGRVLYSSARLPPGQVPSFKPSDGPSALTLTSVGTGAGKIRLGTQTVIANGQKFLIQVAEPLHEFEESEVRFRNLLMVLGPLFLALATAGGLWISSRALSPVDRIIRDTRLISISSLSRRLEEPPANDELKRLTQTLNDMLDRIERELTRIVQFTADASHELRAPLTLIHTAAQFSLRRDRSHEDLLDALRKIERESERTSRLVDDLLTLARADSGNDQMELAPIDLVKAVRTAADQARTLAEPKSIEVLTDIPGEDITVDADNEALARLLLILLDNAVKYTDRGGRIRLSVRTTAAMVELEVSDTGSGISPEDLPRVFDRFWRADKVRSRAMGGAGLGLSIAKYIIEQHGGSINIDSFPGSGSVVRMRLPLSSSQPDFGRRGGDAVQMGGG